MLKFWSLFLNKNQECSVVISVIRMRCLCCVEGLVCDAEPPRFFADRSFYVLLFVPFAAVNLQMCTVPDEVSKI